MTHLVSEVHNIVHIGGDFTVSFRILSELCIWSKNHDRVIDELAKYSFSKSELKRKYACQIPLPHLEHLHSIIQSDEALMHTIAGRLQIPTMLLKEELSNYQQIVNIHEIKEETLFENHRKSWTAWIDVYIDRLKFESDNVPNDKITKERVEQMNSNNPVYVLRNHVAQKAIKYAEQGRFDEVDRILGLLQFPFQRSVHPSDEIYAYPLPPDEPEVLVS